MESHKSFTAGKLALALSFLGAATFYLWQPVADYFIARTYDDNLILQIETEALDIDKASKLLVVHVKVINRGNVPVTLKSDNGSGEISLEIRKADKLSLGKWIDGEALEPISKTKLLKAHSGGYVIAPNAYYDEQAGLRLEHGNYWIKAVLSYENGDYIDQISYVNLGK